MPRSRPKQKALEVLSLHCADREPRPGAADNRWVAVVMVEVPLQAAKNGVTTIRRTVNITAPDELAAYVSLITDGV
jgi:hypothetical protein